MKYLLLGYGFMVLNSGLLAAVPPHVRKWLCPSGPGRMRFYLGAMPRAFNLTRAINFDRRVVIRDAAFGIADAAFDKRVALRPMNLDVSGAVRSEAGQIRPVPTLHRVVIFLNQDT